MDVTIFTQAAQLGGTVFTVVAFLWYLSKRDDSWSDFLHKNTESQINLAQSLQRLTDIVEYNSNVNKVNTGAI